ncbi:sigma-70 family RNA polymerase sigma factor [bacterium]|nr:sigma-70 family RNA polymerase sigma factor [bacterium]
MTPKDFEQRLADLRPRLHRYCARMTGSAIDGEDVLQDSLIKALRARDAGVEVENLQAWLFRIAHNTCLDFLRQGARQRDVPLIDQIEADTVPDPDIVSVSFRTFLQLPEVQRCAVILKDVLGYSIEEIAGIADLSPASAKSALQRGRLALRRLAEAPGDARLPLLTEAARQQMTTYVRLFQSGDFDAIRALLAEEVRLDLVNRLQLAGRDRVGVYFTRYASEPKWRFAFGAVEGRPAMLVFDRTSSADRPAHFVILSWQAQRITAIRDFLFAGYALQEADWVLLG